MRGTCYYPRFTDEETVAPKNYNFLAITQLNSIEQDSKQLFFLISKYYLHHFIKLPVLVKDDSIVIE